ncbi:MAG: AAA family ATPase, partial [Candidatus Limnocylindria bacterium]
MIDGGQGAPNAVLKTLTLTGFKSFVHKTEFEFAPGITAIIGPNGSGKSNLADAVRFALGEHNARVLRAKRNDELIFAGSETRRGLGMAEVLMQLDNSSRRLPIEFSEIEVGRRLFKSGEAEFLVNRARVRLRDLQDLLAGTNLADNPFVVIGQGLVDQVLALRPSDRRIVIEEAAGTRRLHLRREEALHRLKAAEVELQRVIDILREIGPRVSTLQEQAAKWREYEGVRAELRRRALRWYRSSFGTTASTQADLVAKIAAVDREVDRLTDYVSETESLSAATDDELRAARGEEELRRIGASEALAAEASVRERIAALQASVEAVIAERERARALLAALPGELAGLRARRATVDEEATDAAKRARDAADAARGAEEDASRTRLALAEVQAARVAAERAHLLREGEEIRLSEEDRALLGRDEELTAHSASLAAERSARERERDGIARELARARGSAEDAARVVEAAASRAGAMQNDLQRIDGDLALVRGQSAALREAVERADAELAGRRRQAAPSALPKGLRWLHERLDVPERLRPALRAALGEPVAFAARLDVLLDVNTRDLTVLIGTDAAEAPVPAGCQRFADALKLDEDLRPVVGAVLRNVFVAPDQATAIAAARTLRDGVVVTPDGLAARGGILRFPPARAEAERDALAQLAAMAGRLRAELGAAERAQAEL